MTSMTPVIFQIPAWSIIRIAGLASYASLFLGIALGILYSMSFVKGKFKTKVYKGHAFFTNSGLLLALVHVFFLVIDAYEPFSWQEILVPFAAAHSPLANGLGTIALYGLLLIILTTDFKSILHAKLWKSIHLFAYPIFLLALLHGLFSGTDTKNPYIYWSYVGTFMVTILMILIKMLFGSRSRGKKQAPRPPGNSYRGTQEPNPT